MDHCNYQETLGHCMGHVGVKERDQAQHNASLETATTRGNPATSGNTVRRRIGRTVSQGPTIIHEIFGKDTRGLDYRTRTMEHISTTGAQTRRIRKGGPFCITKSRTTIDGNMAWYANIHARQRYCLVRRGGGLSATEVQGMRAIAKPQGVMYLRAT